MSMIFCHGCGKEIHQSAVTCPHCGAPQSKASAGFGKKQNTAFLLAFFAGGLGAHRFYLGNIGLGLLYLFTLGLLGVGALIDLFNLAFMRAEVFAAKYNNGAVDKPIGTWAKALALVFPLVIVMGILSSIVIPAYQSYKERSAAQVYAPQPTYMPEQAPIQAAPNAQPEQEAQVEQIGICKGLDLTVTADQIECLNRKFTSADKQLNETYKQLMAILDDSRKSALKKEQVAWVKEKVSKCNQAGKEFEGGTMETVAVADCEVEMTEKRLAYLKNFQ